MANFQSYLFLFLIWLVSIVMVRAILTRKRTTGRRPPSPLSLPLIVHLYLLTPPTHQALHKLSTRCGPIMQLVLGSISCIIASTPETLRLHPPVSIIGRKSSESCIVCGYEIPANSPLYINTWAIGRDPNYWEDPLEFRPERFMDKGLDVRGQNFQLIPFGSGTRVCPGISLAFQVVPTNLAAMIHCFEWKIEGGNGIVDMEEKPGLSLARAHPLICFAMPRLNPFPFI